MFLKIQYKDQQKKLLLKKINVVGIDNFDNRTGVNLKKKRYEILKKDKNKKYFKFYKTDITNKNDLNKLAKELSDLERKITLYHAKIVNDLNFNNNDFEFNCSSRFENEVNKYSYMWKNEGEYSKKRVN